MAVTFSPRLAFHGFDRSVSPNWQMVPVGSTRVLTLAGVRGLVPRVRDTSLLEAVQTTRGGTTTLTLTGKAAGRTWVEWVPSLTSVGAVQTGFTLEVSVKDEKKVRTAFHYVDDGRRQVTRRRIAHLNALTAEANAILTPQANVTIERKSAAALAIAQDLGRVVRFASHLTGPPHSVPIAQHEWDDMVALADATADFNVFFVREYEDDTTPLNDLADAGTLASDKTCVFEDRLDHAAGRVLAHETMHLLGFSGHSASRRHLIATGEHGLGRIINRDQANTINPSGT
jgi:hypothetical protein